MVRSFLSVYRRRWRSLGHKWLWFYDRHNRYQYMTSLTFFSLTFYQIDLHVNVLVNRLLLVIELDVSRDANDLFQEVLSVVCCCWLEQVSWLIAWEKSAGICLSPVWWEKNNNNKVTDIFNKQKHRQNKIEFYIFVSMDIQNMYSPRFVRFMLVRN